MHSLTAITALGGAEARIDTVGNTTLSENPTLALASVAARAGQEAACITHLETLLNTEVPGPGEARMGAPEMAFWMGPNQWMVAAPIASHEDLVAHLKTRFAQTASLTEQTDAWVCFDLSGEGIEDVMELLCAVNFPAMQIGAATRTTIHHLGCFILRRAPINPVPKDPGPENGVRILGPRASAGSLHHAILTAMRSTL